MSDYDGMDYEELLDECEWMSDFLSLMAERITKNPDVHNLVDYVRKIEGENAKMRELMRDMFDGMCGYGHDCRGCEHYELHEGQRFVGECEYHRRIRELGIEVDR